MAQSPDSNPSRSHEALTILQDAIKNNSKNSQLYYYELAHISYTLGQYEKSLAAIEVARSLSEAVIFALMARIHHKLDNYTEFIACFQTAIDLDPKEIGFIKEDLDALDTPDLRAVLHLALSM